MSKADLSTADFALFHPAAHYDSPNEVLSDGQLSDAEKRVILSSWASDMFAVESCPGLRDIPGMGHPIRLADILAALRQLSPEVRVIASGGLPPTGRLATDIGAGRLAFLPKPYSVQQLLTVLARTLSIPGR